MNAGLSETHTSIDYYDSDYPGTETTPVPENLDGSLELQGIAHDVQRYKELALASEGPVLELCCGTGRIAIPLARAGIPVVAVDVSPAMIAQFRTHLENETQDVRARIETVLQDISSLSLPGRQFRLALIPFNSLLLLTSVQDQRLALTHVAAHLEKGGRLIVDIVNPLKLKLQGDEAPRPFLNRVHATRRNNYTRFAAIGPMDSNQCQQLYGWYDEIDGDCVVRRRHYSMRWRPIFRGELELLMETAGLEMVSLEGGHRGQPFVDGSPRMFVTAVRR